MNDERLPRIERLLDLTARKVSGGGLHPLEILQRVREAAEGSVRDGAVANEITVSLHPADYKQYERSLGSLRHEVEKLLDGLERERGLRRIGDRVLAFEVSTSAAEGTPVVSARFTDTSHPLHDVPRGATRRITRIRGLVLVLGDGSRVRVTHVPFVIGRGPGNDLVVPSLAVSRRHAEIVRGDGGLLMRDLGSRNGLLVDGVRYSEVRLGAAVTVVVGDFAIRLEAGE
jgi:hypothetical protein